MPFTKFPFLWRTVQYVERSQTLGEFLLQVGELGFQQDIFFLDVAEDEGDFGVVGGVVEDAAEELVHGGDSGTAGDQGDMVMFIGRPGVFGDGALE